MKSMQIEPKWVSPQVWNVEVVVLVVKSIWTMLCMLPEVEAMSHMHSALLRSFTVSFVSPSYLLVLSLRINANVCQT